MVKTLKICVSFAYLNLDWFLEKIFSLLMIQPSFSSPPTLCKVIQNRFCLD